MEVSGERKDRIDVVDVDAVRVLLDVDNGGNDVVIPKADIAVFRLLGGLELEGNDASGVADKNAEEGFMRDTTVGCEAENVIDIFLTVVALVEGDTVLTGWKGHQGLETR